MKLYTKTGDDGTTMLLGGSRAPKHHLRIEAYGALDELNSFLGLLHDQEAAAPYRDRIRFVQDRLFTVGSSLATEDPASPVFRPDMQQADIERLELDMDTWTEQLPQLKNFILPGGHPANSLAHVCRTVCRRGERHAVALAEVAEVEPLIVPFLNRLSDWLFVLARKLSQDAQAPEIEWRPREQR